MYSIFIYLRLYHYIILNIYIFINNDTSLSLTNIILVKTDEKKIDNINNFVKRNIQQIFIIFKEL